MLKTHIASQGTTPTQVFMTLQLDPDCCVVVSCQGREIQELLAALKEQLFLAFKILSRKRFYHEAKEHLLTRLISIIEKTQKKTTPQTQIDFSIILVSERYVWVVTTGKLAAYYMHLGTLMSGETHLYKGLLKENQGVYILTQGVRQAIPFKTLSAFLTAGKIETAVKTASARKKNMMGIAHITRFFAA